MNIYPQWETCQFVMLCDENGELTPESITTLDAYGRDGWELVTVLKAKKGRHVAYFKRCTSPVMSQPTTINVPAHTIPQPANPRVPPFLPWTVTCEAHTALMGNAPKVSPEELNRAMDRAMFLRGGA